MLTVVIFTFCSYVLSCRLCFRDKSCIYLFIESLSYVYSSLWSEVLLSVISVGRASLVDKTSFSTFVSFWKFFLSPSTMAIFWIEQSRLATDLVVFIQLDTNYHCLRKGTLIEKISPSDCL